MMQPTPEEARAELERRRAARVVAPAAPPVAPMGVSAEAARAELARRAAAKQQVAPAAPAAPAGPSLRSETDAIIEEAAAAIPGGYEAFNRKPADPQRMAAMGYVQDPLAVSGYARPRAPEAPIAETAPENDWFADIMRGIEAPVAGLTGSALEKWGRTSQEDPLLGAVQGIEFLSPIDDAGRAYQGLKQAGAGALDGDMGKAGEGLQQFLTDGSFAAMQALPGSMTLKGMTAPGRAAPVTLAEAERAAMQASRAPAIASRPAPVAAPEPFSAPSEPSGGGVVRRNLDKIIGGGVGATIGGVGDAVAAPGDGNDMPPGGIPGSGAATGAAIGIFGPRALATAASRGMRAAARVITPASGRARFDEGVAAAAVRKALKSGGIRNAEQAAAAMTARYGDKPAAIADLTQDGIGTAAGISRLPGATGEAARARGEDLLGNRAGRLERDIGQANPNLTPAAITGDIDRMVALARQQATPAYEALRAQNPFGSFASPRLDQLRELDILAPHIRGVDRYRETLAATEGRVVGDFEYWDLVKRSLDDAEQAAIARNQAVPYDLDSVRQAIVQEVDALAPNYASARQLGGEAPRIQEGFRRGQRLLGGRYTAEEVGRLAEGVTGQQLTAMQAGMIRSMIAKTEGPRSAMAALMAPGAKSKLTLIFGPEAANKMQARFAADAAIMDNAQRINPNVGSVTSQAQMGGGGVLPMAADVLRAVRSPVEAALAALSNSGSYTKAQRDMMGQMLLDGATPENLQRIFGRGRAPRGGAAPSPGGAPPMGGNPSSDVDMTGRPMPTPTPAAARQQPSPESVAQAQGQLRAAREASLPEREQIGTWQGEAPQKPQSLLAWVRGQGGIKDRNYMSGDLKAVMGRANAMPGLLNNQSGKGLDDIVSAAYEQGFDVDPNDANSLMRLIEEEAAGNPSYRIGAREEWDIYQEYLAARRGDLSEPPDSFGATKKAPAN
jgi:hypothetical protein